MTNSTEALRKMAEGMVRDCAYANVVELARYVLALTAPLVDGKIAEAKTWLELPMYAGAGIGKYMDELEQGAKHLSNVLDALRVVTGELRDTDIGLAKLITDYEAMRIVLRKYAIVRHANYRSCSICHAVGDEMEAPGNGIKEPPHRADCVLGSGQGSALKARAETAEAELVKLKGQQ